MRWHTAILLICAGLFSALPVKAQQLTPHFYWPSPRGTKVAVAGYSHASGYVPMDPSVPLNGVDSRINTVVFAHMQNFNLLGRTVNFLVELPYTWGMTEGTVINTRAERRLSGFNDMGITLAVNLLGAPSMNLAEFQQLRNNPRVILATSIEVKLPTGQYMTDRLINVGTNRWAFRPEFGTLIPLFPKFFIEFELGAWFFTKDKDYIAGTRKQQPILSGEIHLVKRFKPGLWASLEGNYFRGGRQQIGDNQLGDLQQNSKTGGTMAVPFGRRHSIKFG